jgi:hypothetical protein
MKVASRTESTRDAGSGNTTRSDERTAVGGPGKPRTVTIYFVHGQERQSTLEFTLPARETTTAATGAKSPLMLEAQSIEADVDGKMLLRGDVHIRFGTGIRLAAQLVAVTVSRDDGPVEIVVKE